MKDIYTKGIGKIIRGMATAGSLTIREIVTRANGNLISPMERGHTKIGLIKENIQENGKMGRRILEAWKCMKTVPFTTASSKKAKSKELGSCNTRMEIPIREILRTMK